MFQPFLKDPNFDTMQDLFSSSRDTKIGAKSPFFLSLIIEKSDVDQMIASLTTILEDIDA